MNLDNVKNFADRLRTNISKVIVGKETVIEKVLAIMLSGGHILLNDVPGVGKTVLAKSLAISLGLKYRRIQCTPDLLPSDITGLNILDIKNNEFIFKPGPLFTDILLADEINRTTPRTQSALLEAMAEKQVTIDGKTNPLSDNFFVIATQNPIEFEGTFPLPEAQMDRFTASLSVGYPDNGHEIKMLLSMLNRHPVEKLEAVTDSHELEEAVKRVKTVRLDDSILRYIIDVVASTRVHKELAIGASPRGSIALMNVSRGLAAVRGRDFVIPDDVKEFAHEVLAHRIILKPEARLRRRTTTAIIGEILNKVEVPILNG